MTAGELLAECYTLLSAVTAHPNRKKRLGASKL
jgi:hypothetical protein